jgi:hypothetical protein
MRRQRRAAGPPQRSGRSERTPHESLMRAALDLASPTVRSAVLLVFSNVFMTFAWYAHLKDLRHRAWYVAALVSWGIALFEYLLQVPANRIGAEALRLDQLKILQEVISLTVFVPFALLYMKRQLTLDYLWACLCIAGAVYFLFRGSAG